MDVDYQLLANLHQLLRHITELNDQLKRCPRMVTRAQLAETAVAEKLTATRTALTQSKLLANERQLQLKQRESRITTQQAQRNACGNNREFQILTEQIAADQKANEVLSDEILELLERIDQQDQEIVQLRQQLVEAQTETKRVKAQVAERLQVLEREMADVNATMTKHEQSLPGQLVSDYRRLVSNCGDEALAETTGQACGRCHQVLTTQTMSELFQRKIVFCKSCGSLMYLGQQALADRT